MRMDKPVTGLTNNKTQPNYFNFDLLSFKMSNMICPYTLCPLCVSFVPIQEIMSL